MIAIHKSQDKTSSWKLVPFSSKRGPELELQTVVAEHPEIVPWKELELTSPLWVLGKEVQTVEGKFIDHLAVDSAGHIYIFECKIVINHEMRSVIAQALEYAAQLSLLTTLNELFSALQKTEEIVLGEIYNDWDRKVFLKGLQRSVREADYRIILITDYAGNSSQARVNRTTVEYLRSSNEIHLVEIGKFENEGKGRFFVPHITAGGGPLNRAYRQIEVWKRNLFDIVLGNPDLQAALLAYIQWIQIENPDGTKVTPGGALSSWQEHYIAYIEPHSIEGKEAYRIWRDVNAPECLDPESTKRWDSIIQEYKGKLGQSAGKNYYLLDSQTEPEVIRHHFEMQQALLSIIRHQSVEQGED